MGEDWTTEKRSAWFKTLGKQIAYLCSSKMNMASIVPLIVGGRTQACLELGGGSSELWWALVGHAGLVPLRGGPLKPYPKLHLF